MPRPKQNRVILSARVDKDTPAAIASIAQTLRYLYNGKPSQGAFLDAIAKGELLVIKKVSKNA
jgi:hypothetical protein